MTSISISVDAVIYSDGEVVGPDTRQYTKEIELRDQAMRSVAASVGSMGANHTEAIDRLATISANAARSHNRLTQLEGRWAATLRHSPNLNGTIAAINSEPPLPTFFRVNI